MALTRVDSIAGLPIFYDFTADWCVPCQMMEREVFDNDGAARAINARYIPVKVEDLKDVEGENRPAVQALMDKHRVISFPTLVLVEPDGKVLKVKHRYDGYTETLKFLGIPTPSGRRPVQLPRPGLAMPGGSRKEAGRSTVNDR